MSGTLRGLTLPSAVNCKPSDSSVSVVHEEARAREMLENRFPLARSLLPSGKKYRILILICDTGGGHRSSANAIAEGVHHQYPGLCDIEIIDLFSTHGYWPFNNFGVFYRYFCDNPPIWSKFYAYTKIKLSRQFIHASEYAFCASNFRNFFAAFRPDLVCSVHPMCQHLPLALLDELSQFPPGPQPPLPPCPSLSVNNTQFQEKRTERTAHSRGDPHTTSLDVSQTIPTFSSLSRPWTSFLLSFGASPEHHPNPPSAEANSLKSHPLHRSVPFVTVVTDLGDAHPLWFHTDVDLCIVPSTRIEATALAEHLRPDQIRNIGLPLRKGFWKSDTRCKEVIREDLGLRSDIPVCLVVGGGEGIGRIVDVTVELTKCLSACPSREFQVVVICGTNETARVDLESKLHPFLFSPSGESRNTGSPCPLLPPPSPFPLEVSRPVPRIPLARSQSYPLLWTPAVDSDSDEPDDWKTGLLAVEMEASPASTGSTSVQTPVGVRRQSSGHMQQRPQKRDEDSESFLQEKKARNNNEEDERRPESASNAEGKNLHSEHQRPHQIILSKPQELSDASLVKELRDRFNPKRRCASMPAIFSSSDGRRMRVGERFLQSHVSNRPKSQHPRAIRRHSAIRFDPVGVERFTEKRRYDRQAVDAQSRSSVSSLLGPLSGLWKWGTESLMGVEIEEPTVHQEMITPDGNPTVHVVLKGLVTNMADWMGAADLIITKAGPATIAEACSKGLPILFYCYLPGQEEGNVKFATEGGFGGYSPETSRVVRVARDLLLDGTRRAKAAKLARSAVDPESTLKIADEIFQLLHRQAHANQPREEQSQ